MRPGATFLTDMLGNDPAETIDALEEPWGDLKPQGQFDFYGDVHVEFLNHQHQSLGRCIAPGKCIDAENLIDIVSPGGNTSSSHFGSSLVVLGSAKCTTKDTTPCHFQRSLFM